MKYIVLFIFVVSMGFVLSACSSSNKNVSEVNEQGRIVKHAMGETKIKDEPKRIVILTNEGTEALLALGVKPVGAVQSWTGNPWYSHIEKEMEGVKPLGDESQVNLEAIASLKPDLIIGNKMRHEKIYTQLSQIAPTVFSETLRGEWKDNFKFYAKTLDKEKEGEEILNSFDNRIIDISKKAGDNLNKKVSIVRFMPGKTRIYLEDSFSGIILKQIGFNRPDTQKSTDDNFVIEISKERLKEADADVVFYFTYDKGDGEGNTREKEWINDPLFKSLNASKNNKVFKVNDVIWNTAGGIKAANLMLDDIERFIENDDF